MRDRALLAERERDEARDQRDALKDIFPRILIALQSGNCAADCSVDFLQEIPKEVRLVRERLQRERDEARVLADRLAALLQRDRDGHGGQVVDPECDCCDCKWLKPIDEALVAWKEARSES